LGGIGIFVGMICAVVLWCPAVVFSHLQYILFSLMIIILVGTVDDIYHVRPRHKLLIQILVAIILIYKAQVQITDFHGVLGIHHLPQGVDFLISLIAIVGIINAFNLIDGINGLAGSIGLLVCLVLGYWFYSTGNMALATMSASLGGALLAFLRYNWSPAKIFMGDTGSMLIGTFAAVAALKFVEMHADVVSPSAPLLQSSPAFVLALLVWPVFDTLQVFVVRIAKGRSPFHPDKNHVHHHLLRAGLSHIQATSILLVFNVLLLSLVKELEGKISVSWLILLILSIATSLNGLFIYLERRHQKS
jgi:UDP-N-acetylmuramyl pentapeptide phosphotransferase/UDP-N-acetylglucosamine-1-phosphate transferase